jgi:predicted nucleic acid-binding protein
VIVADTNLLVGLWAGGTGAPVAEALRRRDQTWVAPRLWRSEFRNALIGMIRARLLDPDQAVSVMSDAERAMATHEYNVVSRDVLALALRSGCSAYDCEFVALAESLDVRLVTFDREVRTAFPDRAIAPEAFLRD